MVEVQKPFLVAAKEAVTPLGVVGLSKWQNAEDGGIYYSAHFVLRQDYGLVVQWTDPDVPDEARWTVMKKEAARGIADGVAQVLTDVVAQLEKTEWQEHLGKREKDGVE